MNNKCFILLVSLFITFNASASYSYSTHDVKALIIEQAQQQNLSPALALAVAKVESDFNDKATSHAGARGVMQIMPLTAESVFGVNRNQLYQAETNIHIGIKFLKQLLDRYDQRLDLALSHYNGGSAVKRKDGSYQVIPTTRKYVDKVLSYYRQFDIKDSYSPYSQKAFNQQTSYNYLINTPLQPKVSLKKSLEDVSLKTDNDNKKSHYASGLMIKGPAIKRSIEPSKHDMKIIEQVRRIAEEPRWLDSYSAASAQHKVTPYNRSRTQKVNNEIVNNRQEKVRQWESIFK